ncbi:hypothetical protein Bca101_020828 [Brassica carinata]
MSNSNSDESPENYTAHPPPPPPPSLSLLPDEIVLRCLARVPRSYDLSLSWVSKDLRSLVRSPDLTKLRSILHKSSLHLCLEENESTVQWLTLRPTEETETTEEYRLVPNPTPFPSHPNYRSSAVAVGSKIFFIGGGCRRPSTALWILDTRSGNISQGARMSVPRDVEEAAVGVIDGKIYVIGGGRFGEEEIQVEVFDPKSETWELAGLENLPKFPRCSASVEGKVYMVEDDNTAVYNPRESEGERLVQCFACVWWRMFSLLSFAGLG